jgi:alkylation response protein AidB-like acyl-CoA dehydrogenase
MDAEERELFAKSLDGMTARHAGAALDAALDDLGWRDALPDDPRTAVGLLFERQGAAGASSAALDAVLLAALDPDGRLDTGRGGRAALVLPALGGTDPPGSAAGDPADGGAPSPGGRLDVRGLALASVAERDRAVVVAESGDGPVAVVVDTGDLVRRTIAGIDPRLGLVEVSSSQVPAATTSGPVAVAWEAAVAAGQRALAHELVGASRTMLALARTHALERIQFGRPIASFQAVRHRLAEAFVAIEAADAALAAAWDDATPFAAAVAKAVAGRNARTVARHCQQVLAGIGFTTEHDLHLHVRRTIVLDRLLGDHRTLTRRLGQELLARRALPSILPL